MSLSNLRLRSGTVGFLIAIALSSMLASSVLAGSPGELDVTFSNDGKRFIDFGRVEGALHVSVDPAGRLTVAGYHGRFDPVRDAIARLLPNGSLDREFGRDGRVIFDPPNDHGVVDWSSAPDGSLIGLGWRGGDRYYLVKFGSDGSIDEGFGNAGIATGRFAGGIHDDMIVIPSGRILVLGTVDGNTVIKAHRLDGSRSMAFGEDGVARINGESSRLVPDPVGRFFVTGVRGNRRFVVDAFLANGSRDASFGRSGRGHVDIDVVAGEELEFPEGTIDSSGDLILAGDVLQDLSTADLILAKLDADGRADATFGGGDAWRRMDIGPLDFPSAVTARPDGRFVIAGMVLQDLFGHHHADMFLLGLKADGSRWTAFGDNGVIQTDFGFHGDVIAAGALMSGGKLVVAGEAKGNFFVARYKLN